MTASVVHNDVGFTRSVALKCSLNSGMGALEIADGHGALGARSGSIPDDRNAVTDLDDRRLLQKRRVLTLVCSHSYSPTTGTTEPGDSADKQLNTSLPSVANTRRIRFDWRNGHWVRVA